MKKRLFFRLSVLPALVFFNFFSFISTNIFAQEPGSQVKISIRILETGYRNISDKGKNRLVWKFYKGASHSQDAVLTNSKFESCFILKSKKNNKAKEISDEKDDLRPFFADISGFSITMEAFLNKKGGEKCIADAKDINYGIKTENIRPDNLAAGEWSDEIKIEDAFGTFYSVIVYKYELTDGLSIIEFSGTNSINDASKNIVLSLPIKLPKKETLPFNWSYSIGSEENWVTIPNSAEDKSKINFNPLKTIFTNKQFPGSQKVNFKAEVEMNGKTEATDTFALTFVSPPPAFDVADMQLIPVCNGMLNGRIEIKNIKTSAAEIKYVLRKKAETGEPCNFKDLTAESCPGFIKNGTVAADKTLKIRDLAAGEYLLYLFNADLESGEVYTSTPVIITELVPFNIIDAESSSKNPTCENGKSGEIYMKVEGATNLWQMAIIPNKGTLKWDGNVLSIKNLEAGKYTIYLSDRCGPEKSKTFILKKPKQISVDPGGITPLQEKGDFYIQLNILNGSNDYRVKVTDQDNVSTETPFSFFPDMKIPVTKAGVYTIEIRDVATPNCPPLQLKIKVDKSSGKTKFKLTILDK
ncbi:MAG: hypothetical protein JNM14_07710 [Ferruginibacter sp.]|nr:hypothetical protein [Ferruginibacter sp.]